MEYIDGHLNFRDEKIQFSFLGRGRVWSYLMRQKLLVLERKKCYKALKKIKSGNDTKQVRLLLSFFKKNGTLEKWPKRC